MKKYGVAETFTSWQGEGLYTGTRMHFIRFSGCSVGKKLTDEEREKFLALEDPSHQYKGTQLPMYREKCTLYDGREFCCDTNFQTAKAMTVKEIMAEIPDGVKHICLTGGEPLDRDLSELLDYIGEETDYKVHIETSGTVSMKKAWPLFSPEFNNMGEETDWVWLTVSPKKNVLPEMVEMANEIKLLVDESFSLDKVPLTILGHELVWLQPVNYEWDVNQENVKRCLTILEQFPNWRLSMQMHKLWRVR